MKIILHLFACCLFLGSFNACQTDLGNYEYTELNEVTIDGIQNEYYSAVGRRLVITPSLTFSLDADTSLFAYEWWYSGYGNRGAMGAGSIIQTGYTFDMRFDFSEWRPGLHSFYLIAREKSTNVIYTKTFFVFLEDIDFVGFDQGWLLLSDIDGQTRLDFLNATEVDGEFEPEPYFDILALAESDVVLEGAPVTVATYFPSSIFVSTTTDGYLMLNRSFRSNETTTFNLLSEIADIQTPVQSNGVEKVYYYNSLAYYILNGDAYSFDRRNRVGPFNRDADGNRFNIAPFIAAAGNFDTDRAVIFNDDNKHMYRYQLTQDPRENLSGQLVIAGLDDLMSNCDLVHMEYTRFAGGHIFAVLEHLTTGAFYLAQFTVTGTLAYLGEIDGPEIENAEHFAVSPQWGYLLYSSGGNIYEFDRGTNQTTLMMSYPNEQISLLQYPYFINMENSLYRDTYANQLNVCTYTENSPSTSGRMHRYDVPSVNQPFVLLGSYEGFGKIVSVAFNE